VVIGLSKFFVDYGILLLIALVVGGFFFGRFLQTVGGKVSFDRFKISLPYLGNLYQKLYLSRIADNMNTMLLSGISMVRALEITVSVIDNLVYKNILQETLEAVKGGAALSACLGKYTEVPSIMVQMIKVGEETAELGSILQTLAKFYQREVTNAVDTLVDLIEPAMIVLLGLGVGILLASVLIPIYNISTGI
jgi:type IV pilus assembly protein PilC